MVPCLTLGALLLACPSACSRGDGAAGDGSASGGLLGAGTVVDFGAVFEGAVLEHEFLLEVGDGPRPTIESARADCGCTVARLEIEGPGELPRRGYVEGTALDPGTRLLVHVRYDTRGKIGNAPRTVSIYTNPLGKVEVALAAEVKPWLVAAPDRFDLAPIDEELRREIRFEVRSAEGEAFHLAPSGTAIPPEIRVATSPRGGGERSCVWDVRVELGPGLPRGLHAWPIELVSDVPVPSPAREAEARTFSVAPMVTVQVVGAIVPSAPSLSFGALRGDEVASRSIRFTCADPQARFEEPLARLVPARPQDAALAKTSQIHVKRVADANAWDIELVLSGLDDALQGTFLAHLVIETTHPRDPRFEVPVTGFRLFPEPTPDRGTVSGPGRRLVGSSGGN